MKAFFRPVPHAHGDPTRHNYDRIAPYFEAIEGFWERHARSAGLDALAPRPGERIIEIGPGTGTSLVTIAGAVRPGGVAVGVDLSESMCRRSARRLALSGKAGYAVQADAHSLPLPSDFFDAGFMSFTLELFPEMSPVLLEVTRVLRPGGRLVVTALSSDGPERVMRRIYNFGHRKLPHFLDCRPIPVAVVLERANQVVKSRVSMSIWGLPVEVAIAEKPA